MSTSGQLPGSLDADAALITCIGYHEQFLKNRGKTEESKQLSAVSS